jgi:hypothetical protein
MDTSLNNIAIEAYRLINFLQNNQLVQANAVCSKLENLFKQKIKADLELLTAVNDKRSCCSRGHPANQSGGHISHCPSCEPMKVTIHPSKNDQCRGLGSDSSKVSQQEPISEEVRTPGASSPPIITKQNDKIGATVACESPRDTITPVSLSEPPINPNELNTSFLHGECNPRIEDHHLWKNFKATMRTRQYILDGRTSLAFESSKTIVSLS